ncbi:bifunctional RNase H/acid phosphatase [Streptacidiphilus sp. P02-A3a]|uniref:bifunctional RNase H/acid phosphatase n=1 Tax=Streptacidiphilus sp. P02-A3a TaxID=2704468 RepID=UPI0015FC3D71|nr:bifunctional RNase H/acid phosphatase [Streptacidiphilus sp. P02-A3a]QMU68343.1 bifunctional RNase H/acid phosphatase [Streptacidiphilus sp. P02-A3a]
MTSRRFIIEADGGSRGNPGPAGYGATVRDGDTGELLAETAEYLGRATNNVAEYRGLIAGLRAARELDPTARVDVRMDSKLVVEQMSGRWKIKHPDMQPLAAEAKQIFPSGQVGYTWIPRDQNKDADRLANEAMDAGQAGRQWTPRTQPAPTAPAADAARSEPQSESQPGSQPGSQPAATEAAPAVGWARPDLGAPTTLLLLRHGETALTPEKRFSGSGGSDPELSEYGRVQADRAAAGIAAHGAVQAVVSSPLLRCRQTAQAAADRLGLEVRIAEGLRETDFGAFEGLTFAEAKQRFPAELDAWLASAEVGPPGGESFAAVTRRVAVARDQLLARYAGKTVLVVSHVTPVKTLVRLALGAPSESLFRMELSPAALSVVQYYADGNASLRLFNDTSHLR